MRAEVVAAVILLAVCIAAVVVANAVAYSVTASSTASTPIAATLANPSTALPADRWAVIGTGLAAATAVYYMEPPLRAATSMREASARFGGRVLTAPKSIAPMNTVTQALEFGAWVYDAFGHTRVKALLLDLQVTTYLQVFYPAQSFTYFNGVRQPWPPVPTLAPNAAHMRYADIPADEQAAWQAHTGISVADAPDASAGAVWNLIIPITAAVVTGLGWQAVPTRAIRSTQVQYGHQLNAISVAGGFSSGGFGESGGNSPAAPTSVRLQYTSGDAEDVQGVVLACGPADLAAIDGVTADAKAAIAESLIPITQGVLYGQWPAADVWWPAAGFDHAVAATDTHLGRIGTADAGTLRCKVTGVDTVTYWTQLIVNEGMAAAAAAMAALLSTVFGVPVPAPAYVTFRGWPNGLWLWKTNVNSADARARMVRPCGKNAPVWWACADISDNQGWAEGAVEAGLAAAAAANAYIKGAPITPH
jgi:hypothetical protein